MCAGQEQPDIKYESQTKACHRENNKELNSNSVLSNIQRVNKLL